MKNIIIIFLIIVISLLIANTASYQEKSQKDNATIIQILKDNKKLQLEIIDLKLQLEIIDFTGQDMCVGAIELGSAEWFPTRSEWTNMSKQEKKNWEKQYNFLNQ
jgi:hypothetical protein